MYLLYVDESGKPTGGADQYFVVGGVALHEEDCYPLSRALNRVVARAVPGEPHLELHASRIWSGRHEWSHVTAPSRRTLIATVLNLLATWKSAAGCRPRLFAVAVHKPSFAARSAVELAHEQLFARFDELLSRLHRAGESHRALVVADDSSYEKLLQQLVPAWKAVGTRMGRLHSFAEVPLYVDSTASRLVQAADFVAWATWHYYEHNHTQHLQRIHRRFDVDGGVQHGLTHMVRDYGHCPCIACRSRRERTVRSQVPMFNRP